MAEVEIKRVTLHPLKADGTPNTNINLYPKTLVDGVVDREGNIVDIATQTELEDAILHLDQDIDEKLSHKAGVKEVTPTNVEMGSDYFVLELSEEDCADIYANKYDFLVLDLTDTLNVKIVTKRQVCVDVPEYNIHAVGYEVEFDTEGEVYYLSYAIAPTQVAPDTIFKRIDSIPIDDTPTHGSQNAVSSGGVYDALQTKADVYTAPVTMDEHYNSYMSQTDIDYIHTHKPTYVEAIFNVGAYVRNQLYVLAGFTTDNDGHNYGLTYCTVNVISGSIAFTYVIIPTNAQDPILGYDGEYATRSDLNSALSTKQDTLVSGQNIKTINNESIVGSGNINISASKPFSNSWPTTGTTKAFCDAVNADNNANIGDIFLGGVSFSDLPFNGNGDIELQIKEGPNSTKAILLVLTSGNREPYHWEYTYWNNGGNVSGWIGFQPQLVSGTNIKTINNESVLGSGNLDIEAGGGAYLNELEIQNNEMDLIDFINNEQVAQTYVISNDEECVIKAYRSEEDYDEIWVNKGCLVSVYPEWSATITTTLGMYVYEVDCETGYLTGGVCVNADYVNDLIQQQVEGRFVTLTGNNEVITGSKTIKDVKLTFAKTNYSPTTSLKAANNGLSIIFNDGIGGQDTTKFGIGSQYTTTDQDFIPSVGWTENPSTHVFDGINLGKDTQAFNIGYIRALQQDSSHSAKAVDNLLVNNTNLLPASSAVYSLGDNNNRWQGAYLSAALDFSPNSDITHARKINANEFTLNNGSYNNNFYSILKFYNQTVDNRSFYAQLQNGIDVNNSYLINLPDPLNNTSPINKGYADSRYQGTLTAGAGVTITNNNVISVDAGGITYEFDNELPASGEVGIFYMIPNGESGSENIYDEYVWIEPQESGEEGRFELIGTTQAEISNMVTTDTDQTIDGIKTFANDLKIAYSGDTSIYSKLKSTQWNLDFYNGNNLTVSFGSSAIFPNRNMTLGVASSGWNGIYLTSTAKIKEQGKTYGFSLPDSTNLSDNSELVDTATAQTIAGVKTFSNGILLASGSSPYYWLITKTTGLGDHPGTINFELQNPTAGTNVNYYYFTNEKFAPASGQTNTLDLGASNATWKDLYLGGVINKNASGYGVALPDTTNYLYRNQTLATESFFAPPYNSTATYPVGYKVVYGGALWSCNTANTTGDWDSSKWTQITVSSGYVDLDTAQTISASKTFTAAILMKNNVGVKYGNTYSNGYTICNDGSGGLLFKNNYNVSKYHFIDANFYPDVSGAASLGTSSKGWGDLYLTGAINKNASTFGLTLPDTTSFTESKEIATTDQITTITIERYI